MISCLTMIKFFLLMLAFLFTNGTELTFLLDAKDEMCFYEHIQSGEETVLEFQVIEGGNLDVDLSLTAPSGQVLYGDTQKQYDSHSWTTNEEGIYTWCFSNKFSTFTSKLVYFDFIVGDDDWPLPIPAGAGADIAMTALEMSAASIHESLNAVSDYQKRFRLNEMIGRSFAEEINNRVMVWSIGEFVCIITVMLCQVFTLRSFFSDKKNRTTPSST